MKHSIIFILFSLMTFYGCDPCKNTNCQNGGVCDNGTCDCSPGYSGVKCQNYDPCYNTKCTNGGVCVNGTCNCPTGYSGSNCQFRSACYFDNTGTISISNKSVNRYVYYMYVKINGQDVLQTNCNYGETCTSTPLKVGTYDVSIKTSTGRVLCSSFLSVVRCDNNARECSQ